MGLNGCLLCFPATKRLRIKVTQNLQIRKHLMHTSELELNVKLDEDGYRLLIKHLKQIENKAYILSSVWLEHTVDRMSKFQLTAEKFKNLHKYLLTYTVTAYYRHYQD